MHVERPNRELPRRYLSLLETGKKTLRLIQEYPSFRRYAESAIVNIAKDDVGASEIIKEHFGLKYRFGPQYTEMGYCVKAFADIVRPGSDNTDIGICASEFYLVLDVLAIALFVQIGVLKRRYGSIKRKIFPHAASLSESAII